MLFEDETSLAFELRLPSSLSLGCEGWRNGWAMSMMVSVSVDGRFLRAVSESMVFVRRCVVPLDTVGSSIYLGIALLNGVLISTRHGTDRVEASLFTPRVLHVKVWGRPARRILAYHLSSSSIRG